MSESSHSYKVLLNIQSGLGTESQGSQILRQHVFELTFFMASLMLENGLFSIILMDLTVSIFGNLPGSWCNLNIFVELADFMVCYFFMSLFILELDEAVVHIITWFYPYTWLKEAWGRGAVGSGELLVAQILRSLACLTEPPPLTSYDALESDFTLCLWLLICEMGTRAIHLSDCSWLTSWRLLVMCLVNKMQSQLPPAHQPRDSFFERCRWKNPNQGATSEVDLFTHWAMVSYLLVVFWLAGPWL